MPDLKLIALDADDLAVLSAHLQDAVLRVGDVAYLKPEQRFAFVANRFDWETAAKAAGSAQEFVRCRTGVRFEKVRNAQVQGINLKNKDLVLELLAVRWEAGAEAPEGFVVLDFAGGGGIRLSVECIEAEMKDLGAAWATKCKPAHPAGEADDGSGS